MLIREADDDDFRLANDDADGASCPSRVPSNEEIYASALPEEQMVPPSVSITHALGSIRSLMMRRWISLVPSKMVVSLASRQ